ncbi:MAG: VWA domain-containing protein, partial [Candidatus Aminicenantes bacterium]|nr:VWA domain-containing protein [Candidatus Aminicenantes bacterium]
DTAHDPSIAFKNGLVKANAFYILYYTPKNYQKDGAFKSIEVKLKEKNYKLAYRKGYYSN